MKQADQPTVRVQGRIAQKLRERQSRSETCKDHKLYEKLQQMSLLCRLFDKQVKITMDGEEIIAPVYLVTPRTVILKNGRFLPLCEIKEVNIC